MLEQVLDFIHNYFEKEIYTQKFKIESGSLVDVDFIRQDQYYRIKGSIFNDGVHQFGNPADLLTDEEFDGTIWTMAVPPAVIDLANDIKSYVDEYADKLNSPYSSESFGGYSYSKATGTDNHGNDVTSWQSKFASRLNHWRKIF